MEAMRNEANESGPTPEQVSPRPSFEGTTAAPEAKASGSGPRESLFDEMDMDELNLVERQFSENPARTLEIFAQDLFPHRNDPTDAEDLFDACHDHLPAGFVMRGSLVSLVKEVKGKPTEYIPVCSPIIVTCVTSSEDRKDWSREIVFTTQDGHLQREIVREADLVLGSGFITPLVDAGFYCARGQHGTVAKLIQSFETKVRKTAPTKTGWCAGPVPAYKLPNGEIIGADPAIVAAHFAGRTFAKTHQPDAEKWRDAMKPFIEGNRILTLAAAMPLAGPLLRLIDTNGFGLHLDGKTTVGKSSAAMVAHAVFSKGELRSAEATSNGWEPLAAAHNDGSLVLDELSPRKGLAKDAYGISNGNGKTRANSRGEAVDRVEWKTTLLTTGEITPAEASNEPVQTGQLVRYSSIPVQAHKFRMFDSIGGFASADDFVPAIKPAAKEYAGTLGPAFIEELCRDLPNSTRRAKELVAAEHERLITSAVGRWTSPQHRRILRNFARVQAGGMLAIDFGLAPWTHDGLTEAVQHAAFRALRHFDNPDFFRLLKGDMTVEAFWMHLEECDRRFITQRGNVYASLKAIGWKDDAHAFINRDVFEGWFGGPSEANAALKQFVGHGLMIQGDGRHLLRKLPRWTGETGRAVCVDLKMVPL